MRQKSRCFMIFMIFIFTSLLVHAETTHENVAYSDGSFNWYASGNPHIVIGTVTIYQDAGLTIEDGCIVQMENAAYFNVHGRLTAIGSSVSGISFSRRDMDDEWYGIRYQSESNGSLHYCTIEHATYYTSYGVYCDNSTPSIENCTIQNNDYGIHYTNCTTPTLSVNNTIQDNDIGLYFTYCTIPSISNQTITGCNDPVGAIYMYRTGEFNIGSGNTITGNTWGLTMDIASYPDTSSAGNIPAAGNTNDDGIQVYGSSTNQSAVWHNVGEDFVVTQTPSVSAGDTLTIDDDVNVKFETGQYINNHGILNANGTASRNGILFSRRHPDDEWYGLRYLSGSSGSLEYCTIENATYFTSYGVYCDNSTPSIENCTIQNNDYGIHYTNCITPTLSANNTIQDNDIGLYFTYCTIPNISNQTITGCNDPVGAIYMYHTGEFHIGSGNTITGNTWGLTMDIASYPDTSSAGNIPAAGNTNDDGIQVYGSSTNQSAVWHNVGEDFVVTQTPSVSAGDTLTIDDDVNVKFETGQYINNHGILNANGTASRNGILFSRRHPDDEWYGLRYLSGSSGSLEYCTIENATYYTSYGVYCDNSTPSIENCTIQNNDYGIHYTNCTTPTLSANNTIQDNDIGLYFTYCTIPNISNQTITGCNDPVGAIYMYHTGEFHIGSGNAITANTWGLTMDIASYPDTSSAGNIPATGNTNDDGIQVYGSSTTDSIIWHNVLEDFIITSTPNINAGGNLIIDDNVTVKFEEGQSLHVYGSLHANGTAGRSGILFTRRDPDDEWYGLRYQSGSSGSLEYCTIENATYFTSYGVYCDNSTPSIENCTIQNNDYGIYYTNCTNPTLSVNNTFQNNDIGLYFTYCTIPNISNQTITGCNDPVGAIYMYHTGEYHIGSGNAITGNTWGLTMDIASYPDTSSAGNIPATGNTNDDGSRFMAVHTPDSTIWHNVLEDFIVTSTPYINAGGNLIIDDNVTVKFEEGQSLHVYGSLHANGTAGRSGILFTRRDPDDEWYGLYYQSGSAGRLDYCTIEHATYYTAFGVFAYAPTSLVLDHCTLQNNDYGFYGTNASPNFISNNQIINNSIDGIHLIGDCNPVFGSELPAWNDIYDNGVYGLYNGDNDITAGYVFWGTELFNEIEDLIFHEVDDTTLGRVNFYPYTNSTHDTEYGITLLAPENVIIIVENDSVYITWDPVENATSYKIYSSNESYSGFTEDVSGTLIGESWTTSIINLKRFYQITATRD